MKKIVIAIVILLGITIVFFIVKKLDDKKVGPPEDSMMQIDGAEAASSLANKIFDLEKQIFDTVNAEMSGNWDKKFQIQKLDTTKKAAKGTWTLSGEKQWIGWVKKDGGWQVVISQDGFKCSEVKDAPKEYEEFFNDVLFTNGAKNCHD